MNNKIATDLQIRRQEFLAQKARLAEEREALKLSKMREFINSAMTEKVKMIENHLVENGKIYLDIEIGALHIAGEYEIEDLKSFWNERGVTVTMPGNQTLINKDFVLCFQLNPFDFQP